MICKHDNGIEVYSDTQGLCDLCDCFVPLHTVYYRSGRKFHWHDTGDTDYGPGHPIVLGWPEVSPGVWKEP